jgi:hypothetical protein
MMENISIKRALHREKSMDGGFTATSEIRTANRRILSIHKYGVGITIMVII